MTFVQVVNKYFISLGNLSIKRTTFVPLRKKDFRTGMERFRCKTAASELGSQQDTELPEIKNFSSSWSNGMAFCALIHSYFPGAFDFHQLDPKDRKKNFDLAFRVAKEKADIYPLLDVEDMLAMRDRPDWKSVFTYVQAMHRSLRSLE